MFGITSSDPDTGIRTGILETPHGTVVTPAFVPVGTQATVKSLDPDELTALGVTLFFVNTYHAYLRPGTDVVEAHGGLHRFMAWNRSVITDSGGFQIFSLNQKKYVNLAVSEAAVLDRERFTKKQSRRDNTAVSVFPDEYRPVGELVVIDDDGVTFTSHLDGTKHRFTPEFSISVQHRLGTDILIAFDECAPYPTTPEYAFAAMKRTHKWLTRSVTEHRKLTASTSGNMRKLFYGVVQGSVYDNLRRESAEFISGAGCDGIAIGGVSVGESKNEMKKVLDTVIPYLTPGKPRHLLGVGEIDDIFAILEHGIDTFDCVQPTRLARMGELFIHPESVTDADRIFPKRKGIRISVQNPAYRTDTGAPDPNCRCFTCKRFTRSYLHHLFRSHELLSYRLATIHNIHCMNEYIRFCLASARKGTYYEFRQSVLDKMT